MNRNLLIASVVIIAIAASCVYVLSGDISDQSKSHWPEDTWPDSDKDKILIDVKDGTGGTASGGGKYDVGDTVILSAKPQYGFDFIGWYEGGTLLSSDAYYYFDVDGPRAISTKFDRKTFVIATGSNYLGGTIAGGGSYKYESKILLTTSVKSGYSFVGWYADDKLISSNPTVYYDVIGHKFIEARYSIVHNASFSLSESSSKVPVLLSLKSTYNVEIQSRSWAITDLMTGATLYSNTVQGNLLESFSYNVTSGKALRITQTVTYNDGYKTTSTRTAITDETVSKHFEWNFQKQEWYSLITGWIWNNKSASWDLNMSFEKYYEYSSTSRNNNWTASNLQKYTATDSYIRGLADRLNELTSDMSSLERANCVLKFVQSIPYVYDIDNKGVSDYWNYPYETLWDQKGDCDDHAILYAALMKAMGYKVAILILPGHMAVGLDVSGASGTYYMVSGVKYYYCEATAIVGGSWQNQYNIGQIPSGYSTANVYVL